MDIGFVGLGNMGFPIARRLLDAQLRAGGVRHPARRRRDSRRARRACRVVDQGSGRPRRNGDGEPSIPAGVLRCRHRRRGVIDGSRVKRFVDFSTVGSQVAERINATLVERGIATLDSPVSGGVAGAQKGTLAVMVSGPRTDFDVLTPVYETIGRPFYVGEKPGSAQTMKLVNNMLAGTALVATCEAVVMGVKSGLDPAVMIDVLNAGSGGTNASRDKFPRSILPRTFDLRLRHGLDGQRRAALSGRGTSARSLDGGRRRSRAAVGGRDDRTRARLGLHLGDQADRAGGRRGGGRRDVSRVTSQVFDAAAISAIDLSSIASNSCALCCAVSPSVSAREKLAITPLLRASRAHASSRL